MVQFNDYNANILSGQFSCTCGGVTVIISRVTGECFAIEGIIIVANI